MGTIHSLEIARHKRVRESGSFGRTQWLKELVARSNNEYLRACDELEDAHNALNAYDRKPWYRKLFTRSERVILALKVEHVSGYHNTRYWNFINANSSLGRELFNKTHGL